MVKVALVISRNMCHVGFKKVPQDRGADKLRFCLIRGVVTTLENAASRMAHRPQFLRFPPWQYILDPVAGYAVGRTACAIKITTPLHEQQYGLRERHHGYA